jgi:hypothetical protein
MKKGGGDAFVLDSAAPTTKTVWVKPKTIVNAAVYTFMVVDMNMDLNIYMDGKSNSVVAANSSRGEASGKRA